MQNRPSHSDHDIASRRSANTTLEMLDDALSKLERRMGIGHSQPASRRDEDISAILARQEALARRPAPQPSTAPMSRAAPGLTAEIALMREELNREMASTISRQFAGMRDELRSLLGQGSGASTADLASGFDRLTRELGLVASRVDNADMGSLRGEVEELKRHVAALAREDTLRDMADRWAVIERELGDLPRTLGSRQDLLSIAARVSEIHDAMQGLPDTRSLVAMEEQMRALAEAVETLASHNATLAPDHLVSIEDRLDEISRAIAAVSGANGPVEFDTTPFDRIEARLSALARQVEDNASARRSDDVERRLMEVAERLSALHESVASAPSAGDAFDAVSARIDALADRFDRDMTGSPVGDRMLDSLNARFEEISRRLDSQRVSAEETGERLFRSIDARMEELARRIEENEREATVVPTFDHMERRIEEIAQLLTSGDAFAPASAGQPDTRALRSLEDQIAALSEKLSGHLPSGDQSALADLAPRLLAITDQLASGRDDVIAAARQAADEAVGRMSTAGMSDGERGLISQLAGDLRGLEDLARHSDDRNARTFEAIHDTLVKVADRIAGLETTILSGSSMPAAASFEPRSAAAAFEPAPTPAAETLPHLDDAPSLDISSETHAAPPLPQDRKPAGRQPISPAEAAALAARAAEAGESEMAELAGKVAAARRETADKPADKPAKGLLGGLRKAMARGATKPVEPAFADEPPVTFGKAAPAAATEEFSDEPLEPGTGGPDLAEIMKRVRAERAGTAAPAASPSQEDDAGKSDFIAAARRAARAAATEASVLDPKAAEAGRKKGKGGGSLASVRRPLLLGAGAILLALLAFPLVKGYLAGGQMPAGDAQVEQSQPTAADPASAVPAAPMQAETVASEATIEPAKPVEVAAVADEPAATPVAAAMSSVAAPAAVAQDVAPAQDETAAAPAGDYKAVSEADIPSSIGPVALREAAIEGDPKALFVIGDRLMGDGPGATNSDMKAAAHWYEMAAELGFAPAQYRIGNAYEKGYGVDRDLAAAKTWYQLAAEQGNASAMHNLAVLFATPVDGKRDMESAARWFQEAAELGVKDSQVNLGILAARGEGVPQDLVESYKWLAVAAAAGDNDAAAKRDEVAKFMRPDQLDQAKGEVELWKARPLEVAVNSVDMPDSWQTSGEATATTASTAAPPAQVDMKKAIRNIQAILNNAGYDAGTPDGVMGAKTRNAITDFQKANGLLPTGEVDKALVDKLLEINRQT